LENDEYDIKSPKEPLKITDITNTLEAVGISIVDNSEEIDFQKNLWIETACPDYKKSKPTS